MQMHTREGCNPSHTRGCNPLRSRLLPFVLEAVTLCTTRYRCRRGRAATLAPPTRSRSRRASACRESPLDGAAALQPDPLLVSLEGSIGFWAAPSIRRESLSRADRHEGLLWCHRPPHATALACQRLRVPLLSPFRCLAAFFCVPLAAAAEGQFALATWRAAAPTAAAGWRLTSQIVLTGLYFYGYSEVANPNPNPNPHSHPDPHPHPHSYPNPNP